MIRRLLQLRFQNLGVRRSPRSHLSRFQLTSLRAVELFLDNVKQDVFKGTALVTHEKEASNLWMNWNPLELRACPDGFSCDEFISANLRMCCKLKEGTYNCHPIADKRISLNMRLSENGVDEATNEVVLNYRGCYRFYTKLVVKCNLFESESFELDSGAGFIYHEDNDGKVTVILNSKLTCARQFARPTIPPTPKPAPPVDSNSKVDCTFTSDIVNGHVLKFDFATK